MKNLIGKTIKNFQVVLKVRETATRILYRACDARSDRTVGLEVVKAENIQQKVLYAALKEQAEKNARLKHSNIPGLLDSGIQDGIIFFVYDFSPARTLRRLFNQEYPWKRAAREFVTVAQTLAHAHQQGVVHGMLEPSSIILNEERVPYLYDFGMEQIIQNHLLGRSPGAWIQNWKFPYASPEQLSGKPVDAGSDVYSMGIMLYEWMTGEIPLLDETTLGTLYRRTTTFLDETALKKIDPPALQELISRTIATDPARRYRSMQEVSILLARQALGLGLTRRIIRKPLSASQVSAKRSPKWLFLPFLSVVLLGIAFAAWQGIPGLYAGWAASLPRTATPPVTVPLPTATRKPLPTLSPATAQPTPTAQATAQPASVISYPLRVGSALPPLESMNPSNASHILQLAIWGAGEINRYALSPDGKTLAVAASQGVFIYQTGSWVMAKYLETNSWVSTVAFSPDGSLLAAGDQGGLILLWETAGWKEIKNCIGHRGGVTALAFSPDGTGFVSAALDDRLLRWDTTPGTTEPLADKTVFYVTDIIYSADGSSLITGGSDWKVSLWEPGAILPRQSVSLSGKVVSMQRVGSSSLLAVGMNNRQVALVDLAVMKVIRNFSGMQADLSSVAVSPDGMLLAAGDVHGGIVTWNASGGAPAWKSPAVESIPAPKDELLSRRQVLAFAADGKTILSGLRSGSIRVFDAGTGEQLPGSEPITYFASGFEFSGDGQTALFQTAAGTLRSLDVGTGSLEYTVPGSMLPVKVFSSNSRLFAVLYDRETVQVYESAGGKQLLSIFGNSNVRTLSFLGNDNYLGIWNGQEVRLWSISSGQRIKTIPSLMGDGCTTISGPYKNVMAFVTGYDYLFDSATNRGFLCDFRIVSRADRSLISEATRLVVAVEGYALDVYPFTSDGSKTPMHDVGQAKILHMAVHPEGRLLAAALDDHSIRIWDIASQAGIMDLYGHDGEITDLHFTNDGRLLVSSSLDGTIRLWGIP